MSELERLRAELAALREAVKPLVDAGKAATPGPWKMTKATPWSETTSTWDEEGAHIFRGGIGAEGNMQAIETIVEGGQQDEQGGAVGVLLNVDAEFIVTARAVADALAQMGTDDDAAYDRIAQADEAERKARTA